MDRSLNQWLWNYLNMHQQFANSIIFENIANQRQIKFLNARTKKSTIKLFFWSKFVTLAQGRHIYQWKNLRLFRLVSAIFYQIFIFHQMIALQKLWKMFFLFHLKSSICFWDIQIFVFSSSLLVSLVSHCFRGWSKKNLKVYDVTNYLNKNLITHFVWYLEKEKTCDIETLSIDRELNKKHFYGKIMQKMCTKS